MLYSFSQSKFFGLSEKELLHAKLIRDNDKTDNFRVKLTESFKVLLGTDDVESINNEKISVTENITLYAVWAE